METSSYAEKMRRRRSLTFSEKYKDLLQPVKKRIRVRRKKGGATEGKATKGAMKLFV